MGRTSPPAIHRLYLSKAHIVNRSPQVSNDLLTHAAFKSTQTTPAGNNIT